MVKKELFLIIFLFLVSFVSADIQISELRSVYNLGDQIITTLTINPTSVSGNFEYSLNCGEEKETIIFYKGAENYFEPKKELKLNTKILLEREYIRNLTGECYLKVSLGSESISSSKFKISNKINTNINLNKYSYDPGEAIVVEINAVKENGEKFNGFLRARGIVSFEKEIREGYLKEVVSTNNNQESGDFQIELFFYDYGKDKQINNLENKTINIKINQIPYSVPLTISSLEINPGEELKYSVNIYDQSGKEMKGSINVEFVSPDKKKIIKRSIESGGSDSIKIPLNESAGVWTLASYFGAIREEKYVTILKKSKLDFEFLENSSVVLVRNIGNSVFSGDVVFEMGGEKRNLTLTILPGEERRFSLSGLGGKQDVRINAGGEVVEKNLLLTGGVVDVKEIKKNFSIKDYPIVWGFIIFLFATLIIIIFFKYKKRTFVFRKRIKENIYSSQKEKFVNVKEESNEAESSLVVEGTKEPCTFIVLRIKNNLSEESLEKVKKIIREMNKYGGSIEFREKEAVILFSPKKTKSFKNEFNAIRYSYDVSKIIDEINRKFEEKILYGIGINSGDIISKIDGGKIKYTCVDNSISYARKIATNFSNNNVVISEKVKNKLLREIRTDKIEKDGNTYYAVKRISDKQENEVKLKDLLKRMNISSSHD